MFVQCASVKNKNLSLRHPPGALAQTYTFDSFGKQTNSSGSLTNSFQYTARESDIETGLYYYRARYYDQSGGRFLSEDPLGFEGGYNFYEYGQDSPENLIDPFGLQSTIPPGCSPPFASPCGPPMYGDPQPWKIPPPAPRPPSPPAGWDKPGTGAKPGEGPIPAPPVGPGCPGDPQKCKDQWQKDLNWCAFMFPNNFKLYFACTKIADDNLENCLDGKPRVDPDPDAPKGPPKKGPIPFPNKPRP